MGKSEELLLLIAISGEMPANWVGFAVGSDSYAAALVTRLKGEGKIKVRNGDGIKGYILRAKAKQHLLEQYREDVQAFLTGASCTNHVKSEPEKRLRLHRMSIVWIFCRRVGIVVFPSRKPRLFLSPCVKGMENYWKDRVWACYYGTAEWKQKTDQEIRGSRACGLLLSERAFVVYNTMDTLMKWTVKTERNVRARIELWLRKNADVHLQGAVILGTADGMLKRLLASNGGVRGSLFAVDDVYESYYYVPARLEAGIQLRLLCSEEREDHLRGLLGSMLALKAISKEALEDGRDREGKPVYFCYLLELKKLQRILCRPFTKPGRVLCFAYQARELREIFPTSFTIEAIRPEKAAWYLGWKNC